jgi:putative membrane protein
MIAMMYWYGGGMSGWGYALMAVSMVLFWGAVIFAIVALVRSFGRGGQSSAVSPPPEHLLAERFARGEIGEEEYRQRLSVLHDAGHPAGSRPAAPAATSGRLPPLPGAAPRTRPRRMRRSPERRSPTPFGIYPPGVYVRRHDGDAA